QLQPRMPHGDPAECCHMAAGQEADWQLFALAGGPEPVEAAIGPPALLVRLVERETEAEHTRPLPPVPDDLLTVWRLQVEITEDAELVGMMLDCFDRERVHRLAQGRGRMDHCGVDPGLG